MGELLRPRFNSYDCIDAAAWGLNCGPAAVACIAGLTLDELRPHLDDFELKRYTNPTLMWRILKNLALPYRVKAGSPGWPKFGLARIQWEGPWTKPLVPMMVRYRHTHWVGVDGTVDGGFHHIFDINAIGEGGWLRSNIWADELVPWLLEQCEPKANGKWHITHAVEIERVKNG